MSAAVPEPRLPEPQPEPVDALDPRDFRDTLGSYASGVTVVTGMEGDEPVGFTCQSFYSVSLDPPLVSFSVAVTSTSWPRLRDTGRFCVNVLAADQHDVSRRFAVSGSDKWSGVAHGRSPGGMPVLDGSLIWVDCTLDAEYPAGDHTIVLGRVHALSPRGWHDGDPLVFFRGAYRELGEASSA